MPLDRFDCYELCVQSPRHVTALLHAIAARDGNEPTLLREDFCGSAAVSRRWIEEAHGKDETHPWRARRAIAIDCDADVIDRARRLATPLDSGPFQLLQGDCAAKDAPAANETADIVFVGNFSIGYCHARSTLVRYLKQSFARLKGPRGVFACDSYGGPGAFAIGGIRRRHPSKGHETIHYIWQHEEADPSTGMVTNSISFEIERDGQIVEQMPRAFVYRWRLWSLPELRDAMMDAGFGGVEVYTEVNVAPGERPRPVADPAELRKDWVAMVVGRA
jgi:hypothetical protein